MTSHCGGRGSILNQSMQHFWQIGTEIRLCSEHHGFPLVLPYHHCSILILILKLLFIGTNGRILKIFTKFQSELYNTIWFYFYHSVYGCTFCKLLFNPVNYVILMLCNFIVMYALLCIFCFHRANWHSSATPTDGFPCFSSVVRQMPGYNSQIRGKAHTLLN
jgi:hypothetical protein